MEKFFIYEGAYLVIAAFILGVTLFVSTRKFFPKNFYKKAVGVVLIILIVAIGSHYYFLNKRINKVKEAFLSSKEILCENRVSRIGARSIVVKKGTAGWKIKDDFFISPQYSKKFFMGRCIVK